VLVRGHGAPPTTQREATHAPRSGSTFWRRRGDKWNVICWSAGRVEWPGMGISDMPCLYRNWHSPKLTNPRSDAAGGHSSLSFPPPRTLERGNTFQGRGPANATASGATARELRSNSWIRELQRCDACELIIS
jgi:hypothetical protein